MSQFVTSCSIERKWGKSCRRCFRVSLEGYGIKVGGLIRKGGMWWEWRPTKWVSSWLSAAQEESGVKVAGVVPEWGWRKAYQTRELWKWGCEADDNRQIAMVVWWKNVKARKRENGWKSSRFKAVTSYNLQPRSGIKGVWALWGWPATGKISPNTLLHLWFCPFVKSA